MDQVVQLPDAMQDELSLDEQLAHVLGAARETVSVDRLHLWAMAPEGDRLLYVTGSGLSEEDRRALSTRPEVRLANGDAMARAVRQKVALLVDGRAPRRAPPTAVGAQSFYALPVIARHRTLGLLVADNARSGAPLVADRLRLLSTFAMHVATTVDNTWLLTELHERDGTLSEALEQQGATAEILKVIAASPTDVQPVFDAIARSAARLCDGLQCGLYILGADRLDFVAGHNISDRGLKTFRNAFRAAPKGVFYANRCLERGEVLHVPDLELDETATPEARALAQRIGYRALLLAPLFRRGGAIGVISVARAEARAFSGTQIELLKTFADQAVIAIENTRLFNELGSRNRDLTEALEQQTATSEILRVISSSPTDLGPVFRMILEKAAHLAETDVGVLWLHEGDGLLRCVATHGTSADYTRWIIANPQRFQKPFYRPEPPWRTGHFLDVREAAPYRESDPFWVRTCDGEGVRTLLSVPLVAKGRLLGSFGVTRREVRGFSEKHIAVVQTFADQAAIAIENTRLFNALEKRNRDLTEALEQQTATSEILRAISQSQRDVQPVFETIAANARKLCEATFGGVYTFDGELISVAALDSIGPEGLDAIHQAFPATPGRSGGTRRAILTRAVVHIPDVREDAEFQEQGVAQAVGFRSVVSVPMLRDGRPVGAIAVTGAEPAMFTERQIAMLQTFADQAVIAIENTRLFNQLESRNRDLTESLEQQTATSEILRVISQSQADVQPVFEAIAANARKLCEGSFAVVSRFDGELIHIAAVEGYSAEGLEQLHRAFPMLPSRGGASARALLTRAVVYIPDIRDDAEYALQSLAQTAGFHSSVAVPMLRDGGPIGAISVAGAEPAMFSERQITMLQTFADQAVIAIENTRLFNELGSRNRDLVESLEQQTSTSEILRVISQSQRDVQPVFQAIAANARKLCVGTHSVVVTFDGELIRLAAVDSVSLETVEALNRVYPMPPSRDGVAGRTVLERSVVYVPDVRVDAEYRLVDLAQTAGYRSCLGVPMIRDGSPIGVITVNSAEPGMFTDRQIAMLQTFADQAVIAVENTRLFNELESRNRDLTESLEQQTATSEILRVISQSQRDVQPVFEAIATNARRLCRGTSGWVHTFDGQLIRIAATDSISAEAIEAVRRVHPMPLNRSNSPGRAILTRAVVYVPDVLEDHEYRMQDVAQAIGARSVVSVPMLLHGNPIGTINVVGPEPHMFSERQIAMLQTFADQAVIAIENTRLFNELETRNRDLTESLERQTATSEILRVISQAHRDVLPVFEAIGNSALRLCGATSGGMFTFDGELIHLVTGPGLSAEALAAGKRTYPMPPGRGGATARAILTRAVAYVADVEKDPEFRIHGATQPAHHRCIVSVPMLRDGNPIGAITVASSEPARFSESQIALLKTFADQAVIAIENTRLFNELESRNRDLTESLEQQTATSEILRVISQSQRDVQPVFEAIAASALKLCEGAYAGVWAYDGDLIHIAALVGFSEDGVAAVRQAFPSRPGRAGFANRAILTRAVVHVPDMREDPEYANRSIAEAVGYRSVVFVPMLREGQPIGTIGVSSAEPGSFSERQVAMLQTFADQAVIAIENTRLFNELEARTAELGRSVDELKALGEVGSAVSSTLDLDTVLTTIVTHANKLAGTQAGLIYDYDEAAEELRPRAAIGIADDVADSLRRNPLRKGEGAAGQAIMTRQPVQVSDIAVESTYQSPVRTLMMETGFRAVLAVPLIREDQVMGALVISRTQPGEFPQQVVDLLATFASQSALAMQNARLFHQLEIASQHKTTFLANMSHELRTPLNAIIGYSEMLQEDAVDEGAENLVPDLKRVNAAGKHLLELINSILDLSKIEAGKMEVQLEDFSVADMVNDIRAVIQPLAEKNGNRLEVDCETAAGTMRADLTKVRQVLFNLLSNACKFTERGTVSLKVEREEAGEGSWFTFSVHDTGIGLTSEQVARLFQEFSQAEVDTARKYGGTGLGLALSRRLCRLMGGDIAVTSELGRGSTFVARLPANLERIREITGEAADSIGTVLVIDDEAVVRDLMHRFLSKEGFRVLTAATGEEGLRMAREQQPDAITLDVMMPGVDGWTVLSTLMASPELADIPVIMLTIVDDKKTGYALGASEYLTKPIDRERLLAVLTRYRRDQPVLVVDDEEAVRQLLGRILVEEGYAVLEADNGRSALAAMGERTPGAILLDLMMPEMDGFEFLDALHTRPEWRRIPVVIITAKDLTAEDHQRLNGSVIRILQKGAYGEEDLLAEVRALVAASIGRRKGRNT